MRVKSKFFLSTPSGCIRLTIYNLLLDTWQTPKLNMLQAQTHRLPACMSYPFLCNKFTSTLGGLIKNKHLLSLKVSLTQEFGSGLTTLLWFEIQSDILHEWLQSFEDLTEDGGCTSQVLYSRGWPIHTGNYQKASIPIHVGFSLGLLSVLTIPWMACPRVSYPRDQDGCSISLPQYSISYPGQPLFTVRVHKNPDGKDNWGPS